ncbi:MAG: hypothetical protein ACAF41_29100 [Leptolyngbya sp. BL-A-14]
MRTAQQFKADSVVDLTREIRLERYSSEAEDLRSPNHAGVQRGTEFE